MSLWRAWMLTGRVGLGAVLVLAGARISAAQDPALASPPFGLLYEANSPMPAGMQVPRAYRGLFTPESSLPAPQLRKAGHSTTFVLPDPIPSADHVISIRFLAGRPRSQRLGDQLVWGRYLVKTHHEEGAFFLDYLSRLKGPLIFGGDLNAPPSARVIRRLTDVAQDAYLATHWWGRPTFDVNFAVLRLDYLFGMNGAVPVESSRLSDLVSDHYPVWARFVLTQSDEEAVVPAR